MDNSDVIEGNVSGTAAKHVTRNEQIKLLSNHDLNQAIDKLLGNTEAHPKSYCKEWKWLMPLLLDSHIQLYVYAKDHYTVNDGQPGGFCETGVHKYKACRVAAECLLTVLESKNG